MRRWLRAALAGVFALASVQAQALPYRGFAPGFTPGLSFAGGLKLAGDCAKPLTSISGTVLTCVDAYNGAYASGGVVQPSLVAAGGSLGGCTSTPGSGLVCTGNNVATIPAGNPATNYCLITYASDVYTGTSYSVESDLGATAAPLEDYEANSSRAITVGGFTGASLAATGLHETSLCVGASISYASVDGGTAVAVSSAGPGTAQTLYLGNFYSGGYPNGANAASRFRSARIVTLPSAPTASTAQTASTL